LNRNKFLAIIVITAIGIVIPLVYFITINADDFSFEEQKVVQDVPQDENFDEINYRNNNSNNSYYNYC